MGAALATALAASTAEADVIAAGVFVLGVGLAVYGVRKAMTFFRG